MSDKNIYEIELAWELMSRMEQTLWSAALALHISDADAGLAAADAAVKKLRSFKEVRSRRPEPEQEAAQAGIPLQFEEFAAWYSVERRIRDSLSNKAEVRPPSASELSAAYDRYQLCRGDFY